MDEKENNNHLEEISNHQLITNENNISITITNTVTMDIVKNIKVTNSADCILKWFLSISFILLLLFTILWDLKRVQTLSEVIHNDHSTQWIDMNHSKLSDWYSPLDFCIMKLNNSNIF